jgi:type I restriction enzyme S subunit
MTGLPVGWGSVHLSDTVDLIMDFRGRTPRKLGLDWGGGDIRAISARNVRMGYVDFSVEHYLASEGLYRRWMSHGDMRRGDVLFTTEAPLGNVALVPDDKRYVLSQRTVLLRAARSSVDPVYLSKFLQSPPFQRLLLDNATGSTALGIQRRRLERLPVTVPPLSEQRRIGRALETVDELLKAMDELIAKKRAIKQGMMQELFSATHPEDEVVPLGSVAGFLSGGTPNRDRVEYWTGDVPWISATTLKDIEVADSDQHVTSKAVVAGSKMAPLGSTLVLVRGSALHSEIRASLVVAPVCFNQDVKALVPSDHIVPKFLTYSVHGNADRLLRLVTSAGNTAGVLDTKVLKEFAFWLPAREIQNRLIAVLDDVTDEIEALERRLEATRAIKQGMMQELLTGCTRLPMDVAP